MAYTNNRAEEIVNFLSSEQGFDLPDSIAIAHALLHDDELLQNLENDKLMMLRKSAAELSTNLLKLVLKTDDLIKL